MARLFVAIEIPPALADALLARVPRAAGVRPAAAHQIHLTLHFLGEQDEMAAVRVEQALGAVSCASFPLAVQEAGYFRGRRASVLWAGVASSPALDDLHASVERAVAASGSEPEENTAMRHSPPRFQPHITLARCTPAVPDAVLQSWRVSQTGLACAPWLVERFILYQSHLHPSGAQHLCRRAYALGASGR